MPLPWNLHTHTYRCLHATGDVEDYAKAAQSAGMTLLGMSDHAPLPDDRWPEVRMRPSELSDYCDAVTRARAAFPELKILLGLEGELRPEYLSYFEDEILGNRGMDYLVGAVHFLPDGPGNWLGAYHAHEQPGLLKSYVDNVRSVAESGMAAFLAHPDLFAARAQEWTPDLALATRDICAMAVENDLALELNAYGTRKRPFEGRALYPLRDFWAEASSWEGLKVVVSSDAHRPEDVAHGDELFAMVHELGLNVARPEELVPSLARP